MAQNPCKRDLACGCNVTEKGKTNRPIKDHHQSEIVQTRPRNRLKIQVLNFLHGGVFTPVERHSALAST